MDRLDKQYLIAKQGHCFGQLGVDANLQCSDARQGHNSRIHAKGQDFKSRTLHCPKSLIPQATTQPPSSEKDCQKITFRNPSSKGGRLRRVPYCSIPISDTCIILQKRCRKTCTNLSVFHTHPKVDLQGHHDHSPEKPQQCHHNREAQYAATCRNLTVCGFLI